MTGYCRQTKKSKSLNFLSKFSKKTMISFVFGLFFLSLTMYLFQVNTIASKGFNIRDLEEKVATTKNENQKLQMKVIELQSMTDLQQKINQLDMVPVDQITYFDTSGQVMARK